MKKNFSQSFNYSTPALIYFLIEVGPDSFVQLRYTDQSELINYDVPNAEFSDSTDQVSQLTKYLYENGIAMTRYRELVRETKVAFSFIDETPGQATDDICLYVQGDRIEISQAPWDVEKQAIFVTLDEMLDNFSTTPDFPHVVMLGIARLLNERAIDMQTKRTPPMLRDFVYGPNLMMVAETINRFDLPEASGELSIIEFQVLSPDSFIWRLYIDGTMYYLYAEDYVQGLEDVHSKIKRYAINSTKLDFVRANRPIEFNDSAPVRNAVVYQEPEDSDEMMQFAVTSGFDFVFLCRSDEDAGRAMFNTN